jgi:hypothetical protein
MAQYRVCLFKRVSNDIGHEVKALQRSLEVEASSEVEALKAAKALYCTLMRIADCSFHADAFEVERLSRSGRGRDDNEPEEVFRRFQSVL